MNYRKLLEGLRKIAAKQEASSLALDAAAALRRRGLRAWAILAEGDATAIAAAHELKAPAFAGLIEGSQKVATNTHTFAREGDETALLAAAVRAAEALTT